MAVCKPDVLHFRHITAPAEGLSPFALTHVPEIKRIKVCTTTMINFMQPHAIFFALIENFFTFFVGFLNIL